MDFIQPLAAVVGVMTLLGATLLVLKKRGAASFRLPGTGSAQRHLELIERLTLSPQHTLHLVRTGGRSILIATSPSGCELLESDFNGAGQ
jgi:hypothetical protein